MANFFRSPLFFLLVATVLEVSGDALVRIAMHERTGPAPVGVYLAGAAFLFGYGCCLNLAPLEFNKVVGLYIATLFIVWQVINFIAFRSLPDPPILIGGTLIVVGGAVITLGRVA